jgi:hypothetical protein
MTDSNELKVEVLLDIINSSAREAMKEYKKNGHGVPGADSTTFHPLDLATDTLVLRKAIRLLEGACHQLSAVLAPPQHTVFNVSVDHSPFCFGTHFLSLSTITLGHAQTLPSERALRMFWINIQKVLMCMRWRTQSISTRPKL